MEIANTPPKKSRLTLWIVVAMVLGIIAGYIVHEHYPDGSRNTFASNINPVSYTHLDVYKRQK